MCVYVHIWYVLEMYICLCMVYVYVQISMFTAFTVSSTPSPFIPFRHLWRMIGPMWDPWLGWLWPRAVRRGPGLLGISPQGLHKGSTQVEEFSEFTPKIGSFEIRRLYAARLCLVLRCHETNTTPLFFFNTWLSPFVARECVASMNQLAWN